MSDVLPLKESSRGLITEVAIALVPYLKEIAPQWRELLHRRYRFDERTMGVLERLSLGGNSYLQMHDFARYFENANYYGRRLSKLQVDTRAVAEALALYGEFCEKYLEPLFGDRVQQAAAALELLRSATFVTISGAYFDAEAKASTTLLAVLDAELAAGDLSSILARVLDHTLKNFGANLGMVLLKVEDSDALRVEALSVFGEPGMACNTEEIQGENGIASNIAQTGEPEMVLNVANNPLVRSEFIRQRANSLWGVPLKDRAGDTMGVLWIGFPKPYEWLPKERELMRAIADRTALAIDRARTHDALREREARIAELSAHLLRVQEEERKRISRELHDETGQALMVIRLYLGMLDASLKGKSAARNRVHETLAVVDRTIEGIRRIIARLSPLLLQELGLIAAIRKEAKDMSKTSGIKVQVSVDEEIGRVAPEVETAVYRVVQEALHNVHKHAQAKNVSVKLTATEKGLCLQIEDDGIGFAVNGRSTKSPRANSFGLAGITERITSLGGKVNVASRKQKGTRIEITVPTGAPGGNFQQSA